MTLSIAIAIHALAAVIWVGGMFFAYMALRPAAAALAAADRLHLWQATFAGFFRWVWVAILALLASGYWIVFVEWGGFAAAGLHVHIMQLLGIIMMLLFLHLWFVPYKRLRAALAAGKLDVAATQLNQVRLIVATNLLLGLLVVAIGASGRAWG